MNRTQVLSRFTALTLAPVILVGPVALAATAFAHPPLVQSSPTPAANPGGAPSAAGDQDHVLSAADAPRGAKGLDPITLNPVWLGSTDQIVTSSSSASGFALWIGRESERYAFRGLATIQPMGYDDDEWVGYHCQSADGKHVLAVVGTRGAMNEPALRDRGGIAYVVRTSDGSVRPLLAGVAVKFHSPGCGRGPRATLIRHLGADQERTEIVEVNLDKATVASTSAFDGQLTSAVPVGRVDIAALRGAEAVTVRAGKIVDRAALPGRPFRLQVGLGGALLATVAEGADVKAFAVQGSTAQLKAGGPSLDILPFRADTASALPTPALEGLGRNPSLQAASLTGRVRLFARQGNAGERQLVDESGRAVETSFPASPAVTTVSVPDTLPLSGATGGRIPGSVVPLAVNSTTPSCAVPRNHPQRQVPQPVKEQLDWAVQMAARNALSGTRGRPANYLNMGLAAYGPSTDFPAPTLAGGSGATVPPAIMNGVLAQENAYRHASRRILPGTSGNPAIGDYYGSSGTLDIINYDAADCGYGAAQVTTGMRAGDTKPYSTNGKTKIAVDYAENVQAGLKILIEKWNQLHAAQIIMNNGDPSAAENWYFALWAYNSGVQPSPGLGNTTGCTPSPTCTDADGNWGLGWTNNPANPDYPQNRAGFLRTTYADAERPGDWPYQERVMGWTETPILDYKGKPSYQPISPAPDGTSVITLPPTDQFCDSSNSCSYGYVGPEGPNKGNCTLSSRRCWWHKAVAYTDCTTHCHRSAYTHSTTAPEPKAVNPHPPACSSTLPAGAVIVDDLPNPGYNVTGCPTTKPWTSSGSFALTTGRNSAGADTGVIDLHQIGSGFGGHSYFTGNRLSGDTAHRVTGTWRPTGLSQRPYTVQAHVPKAGASAAAAEYAITTAGGEVVRRVIDTHLHTDRWVSLGAPVLLDTNSSVTLTNVTKNDTRGGARTVAFDALAFIPVDGQFVERNIDAIAIFSRNTALNTNVPARWAAGKTSNMQSTYDWAAPLSQGIASLPACVGTVRTAACAPPATKDAFLRWYGQVASAGAEPDQPIMVPTQAEWLGFANEAPAGRTQEAGLKADDLAYKIRTSVQVTYVKGADGLIVPGSADAYYSHRTGDTHLPDFVKNIWAALAQEYPSLTPPSLSYDAVDLNVHDHQVSHVDGYAAGALPGRAYRPAGQRPVVDDARQCVQTLSTAGGSIGYRPMLGAPAASNSVYAWKEKVKKLTDAGQAPESLADFAEDIYGVFFDDSYPFPPPYPNHGSHYTFAPPIWHELNLQVCADGTVKQPASYSPNAPNSAFRLYRQSQMPDGYLYVDGISADENGTPRPLGPAAPVQKGSFVRFAADPFFHNESGFGRCDTETGSSGNPWNLTIPPADPFAAADTNPDDVTHCIDDALEVDREYS